MKKKLSIFSFLLLFITPAIIHAQLSVQEEKDYLLSLAAMTYVYQDWQTGKNENARGYNIGAILFDTQADTIVALNRNTTSICDDKTQHAEVRLMQEYVQRYTGHYLNGMKIITTLEPCMMCSGMMIFLQADATYYIQEDPEYGKNIERLASNWEDPATHKVHPANNRCKKIESKHAGIIPGKRLEEYYQSFIKDDPDGSMSNFLYSENARNIYRHSADLLSTWYIQHKENEPVYANILSNLQIERKNKKTPYGLKAYNKNSELLKAFDLPDRQ